MTTHEFLSLSDDWQMVPVETHMVPIHPTIQINTQHYIPDLPEGTALGLAAEEGADKSFHIIWSEDKYGSIYNMRARSNTRRVEIGEYGLVSSDRSNPSRWNFDCVCATVESIRSFIITYLVW